MSYNARMNSQSIYAELLHLSEKKNTYACISSFFFVFLSDDIFNSFFLPMQTTRRTVPFLFVRGDGVILVSPPLRTA